MNGQADEINAAADKLNELIEAVPREDWGERPWHVEECNDTDTMESCPCIVAQGEYLEFDQPQIPPIQYVADAETPEHAAYIAAMDPGVGRAVVRLLKQVAKESLDCRCALENCATQAAREVARQLLKTPKASRATPVAPEVARKVAQELLKTPEGSCATQAAPEVARQLLKTPKVADQNTH